MSANRQRLFAERLDAVAVTLVTISYPTWSQPLRLCTRSSAANSFVSRGQSYQVVDGMQIVRPALVGDRVEPGRIVWIGPQSLRDTLAARAEPATVDLEIVWDDQPDVVLDAIYGLELGALSGQSAADTFVFEAPLEFEAHFTRRYPAHQFAPSTFPGLFG